MPKDKTRGWSSNPGRSEFRTATSSEIQRDLVASTQGFRDLTQEEASQLRKMQDADKFINADLAALYTRLETIADTRTDSLLNSKTAGFGYLEEERIKGGFKKLYDQEIAAIDETKKQILAKFDNDGDAFQTNYMATSGLDKNTAREELDARLEFEKRKINYQREVEKDLLANVQAWSTRESNQRAALEVLKRRQGKSGLITQQDPYEAVKLQPIGSFVPGDKKYSLISHFLTGNAYGTSYSIQVNREGKKEHSFNSADPDCRRTFVQHARALNDGKTTKVTLDLSGGLSDTMYIAGKADPNNNLNKRAQAFEMIAALRYGLDFSEIDTHWYSRNITGERLLTQYLKDGIIPNIKFDPDVPVLPEVVITGFYDSKAYPDPNRKDADFNTRGEMGEKLARFHEIRQAMLEIHRQENVKLAGQGKLNTETLAHKIDRHNAGQEANPEPGKTGVGLSAAKDDSAATPGARIRATK